MNRCGASTIVEPGKGARRSNRRAGGLIGLVMVFLGVIAWSCREETPPQAYVRSIELAAVDASCTEAWLNVTLTDSNEPRTMTLKRNDTVTVVSNLTVSSSDTLIIDEGLLPNRTYTYKAYRMANTRMIDSSTQVALTTMDTTSHNFTWQIDTLGDGGGSVLYDVAIINDTLAYAVGEMYLRDSSGQLDPTRYNLAVWNGSTWSIRRVPYYYQGQPFYHPIQTVYAFAPNDIWFAGNGVIRWNGQQYIPMEIPSSVWGPNRINKIWGSSSSSLYIVGDGGSIAHYSNGTWRRVESGTTVDIADIFGAVNSLSGGLEIIAVAGNPFVSYDREILQVTGTTVTNLSDSGINLALSGVWFVPEKWYWLVGDGIYYKTVSLAEPRWQGGPNIYTNYYTNAIRGAGTNDVFIVGASGEILHFNGMTWRSYRSQTGLFNGQYYAVAVQGNAVFAVGYESPRAIIARGRR